MSAEETNPHIQGLDVSKLSGIVNFDEIFNGDFKFVFVKATEGVTVVDPNFKLNWDNSGNAWLLRSPYHKLTAPRRIKSVLAQARHFVDTIEPLYTASGGKLPPAVTLEMNKRWKSFTAKEMTDAVLEFVIAVQLRLGVAPIVRMKLDATKEVFAPDQLLEGLQLWVEYDSLDPYPLLPAPFNGWQFWRRTVDTSFWGVPPPNKCGLNFFNGTLAQLEKLAS